MKNLEFPEKNSVSFSTEMPQTNTKKTIENTLEEFRFYENKQPFLIEAKTEKTRLETVYIGNKKYPKYINGFWTSKQRQASSLHEISYRACFKPQLPRFFIELFSKKGEVVYDPFSGRGTTVIEAGILGRNAISNDINPLSRILSEPRFFIPELKKISKRLLEIPLDYKNKADIDLSMFYHPKTESEIISLRNYLQKKKDRLDYIDSWIRMVATNRLTGHSKGYFSVYTLPPNQAASPKSQLKINKIREQSPEYRDIRQIIVKKSRSLLRDLAEGQRETFKKIGARALFLSEDADQTPQIKDRTVQLTVTSPPFLDIVNYEKDNWLRCWFNNIKAQEISKKITVTRNLEEWREIMGRVFKELYRITKNNGWVAFEVGEVRKGKIKLDEYVLPLGVQAGFKPFGILVNEQHFTKTSHIWGIKNNKSGTNTNRIVLFCK